MRKPFFDIKIKTNKKVKFKIVISSEQTRNIIIVLPIFSIKDAKLSIFKDFIILYYVLSKIIQL